VSCRASRWALLGLVPACSPSARADLILVQPDGSGDYPTIQAAVTAAADGDVIELADGTFTGSGNHDIDYLGKAITVRSQNGAPDACVIDCQGAFGVWRRGFLFISGEGPEAVLEGLTVTGACAVSCGGGALCEQAAGPTFRDCIFQGNSAFCGGGVGWRDDSAPTFIACVFADNVAQEDGGGIGSEGLVPADLTAIDCIFTNNAAGIHGGGVAFAEGAVRLVGCSFTGNQSVTGGAFFGCYGGDHQLRGCTFRGNLAQYGGAGAH
jgi:hypothetical protein